MDVYAKQPGITVTGIDPNNAFREYSVKNAQKHGLGPGQFNWMQVWLSVEDVLLCA